MMNRNERIAERIGEKLGKNVMVVDVNKNNTVLQGFAISTTENIRAVIYANNMDRSDEEIIDEVIHNYEESNTPEFHNYEESNTPEFDIDELMNKDFIMEHVLPSVIGAKGNEELLKDLVTLSYLDLAIVFRVFITDGMTYLVKKTVLRLLDITETELYSKAMENLYNESIKIISIRQILTGQKDDNDFMYIMTNGNFGANAILRKDLLKGFAIRKNRSFYILPSTIHELILVPDDFTHDVQDFKNMVYEINRTKVDLHDRLSDSVYYYDMNTDTVSVL